MNNVINDYFLNSQLSMAAYAKGLFANISDQEFKGALTDEQIGFSSAQADAFIARYNIVFDWTQSATQIETLSFADVNLNQRNINNEWRQAA